MKRMEQRLTLITIGVSNIKKMRQFYENVFGWQATENSNDNITFFQLNGIQLALFGKEDLAEDAQVRADGTVFKPFTLAHNLQSEEEVDTLFENLVQKGASVAKKPEKTPWGGYSGYIADPEENLWEIAYNPYMEYDEKGNVIG
ncbi:VOC family protein [Fodinibius salsisoli]|uniref:VOC family protein n=1 Tax=Fodinibius salsisoli TaxID=2820877 RepID=A0ABT3PRI4_9BACT|nr:VOC family protein [Fodinibius salsisoli]MCW9708451.1 VOC family protein [Fodinibius salsisoli]